MVPESWRRITLSRGRNKTIYASVCLKGGDGRILNSVCSFTLGQIHMALAEEQELGYFKQVFSVELVKGTLYSHKTKKNHKSRYLNPVSGGGNRKTRELCYCLRC